MSGGSFNYLYRGKFDDLHTYLRALREMAERLSEHEFYWGAEEMEDPEGARLEAARILHRHHERTQAMMIALQARHEVLSDLMKAAEWYKSSDWGPERIERAVKELTGEGDGD